ncbi:MAG: hypothetical protein NXI28_21210, partial [bacterium]|nr:hypothetical protein [bacterium]
RREVTINATTNAIVVVNHSMSRMESFIVQVFMRTREKLTKADVSTNGSDMRAAASDSTIAIAATTAAPYHRMVRRSSLARCGCRSWYT